MEAKKRSNNDKRSVAAFMDIRTNKRGGGCPKQKKLKKALPVELCYS
jgi:hypothetical protein